jgi:hypothetical protein
VENTPKQVGKLRTKKNQRESSKTQYREGDTREATKNSNFKGQISSIANQIKFFARSGLHPSSTHSDWENTD